MNTAKNTPPVVQQRRVRRWPRRAYPEAMIRARWQWSPGYVKATRANILLALRRTRSAYGLTPRAMPYVQPKVGMRVITNRNDKGVIVEIRKPLVRGGDPSVKIALDKGSHAYLFQTALNGYEFAAPNASGEPTQGRAEPG